MKNPLRVVSETERIPLGSIGFRGPGGTFYVWTHAEARDILDALQRWDKGARKAPTPAPTPETPEPA